MNDCPTVELHCSDCNGALRTEHTRHRFTYGVGSDASELDCILPVRICDACGSEYVDEEGEEIRHEAVCRHLRVLTPREIRTLREQYGTQAAFASLTGLGEASLSRWETGSSIQSRAYDNYLRLLQRPANIHALLLRQGDPTTAEEFPARNRFRCIEINRTRLIRQATFVLHPAA